MSINKNIDVVTTKAKQMKRKYSERGTRRDSATIRIDNDTRQILKEIAERLKVPVIEAMKIAAEKLKNDLDKEPG